MKKILAYTILLCIGIVLFSPIDSEKPRFIALIGCTLFVFYLFFRFTKA